MKSKCGGVSTMLSKLGAGRKHCWRLGGDGGIFISGAPSTSMHAANLTVLPGDEGWRLTAQNRPPPGLGCRRGTLLVAPVAAAALCFGVYVSRARL